MEVLLMFTINLPVPHYDLRTLFCFPAKSELLKEMVHLLLLNNFSMLRVFTCQPAAVPSLESFYCEACSKLELLEAKKKKKSKEANNWMHIYTGMQVEK